MSTLQVTNIQDTSGGNSLTTAQNYNGTAKAWVNYDGITPAIRTSFNVSSVTRNATGDYTVAFTSAFSDTNYCIVHGLSGASGSYLDYGVILFDTPNGIYTAPSAGSFRTTTYGQSAFRNPNALFFAIYR